MDDLRESKLHELRRKITDGVYRIDSGAVAEAIICRKWALCLEPESAHTSSIASGRHGRAHVSSVDGRVARAQAEALAA
jgi:Anti-sigma-28 factor, FlgM